MNMSQLSDALGVAVRAARTAGALMRTHLRSAKKVNLATAHDIKLELDVHCQRSIERILHRAFPQTAILGEEGVSGDPQATTRWVVDPIDGTVNFAYGIPHACVSIALQQKDEPPAGPKLVKQRHVTAPDYRTVLGVIYDPFQDELWTAVRGQQARLNGRPIHVSTRRRLADAIVTVGFAKRREHMEANVPYFIEIARSVRKIRIMGAAGLGLAYVACGRFDAYIERGVHLWDIAAGGFIVEQAGGKFWHEQDARDGSYRMIASSKAIFGRLPRMD